MITLIQDLKAKGITIQIVRGDNAGKNRKFKQEAKKANLELEFEHMAPYTPQRNGRVEQKFATLFGRV